MISLKGLPWLQINIYTTLSPRNSLWVWRRYCTGFSANGDKNTWETNYWSRRQDLKIIYKLVFHGKQTQKCYKYDRASTFKFKLFSWEKSPQWSPQSCVITKSVLPYFSSMLHYYKFFSMSLYVNSDYFDKYVFFLCFLGNATRRKQLWLHIIKVAWVIVYWKREELFCVSCHNLLWMLSFGEALFTRCLCFSV